MSTEEIISKVTEMSVEYGPKIISAVVIAIVGLWIIKMITKGATKLMKKRKMDESLLSFFKSLINISLKVMLVIAIMQQLGVAMTSFVAILGAAGLAVGMALSGTLQNFAGGVMILIFKPFKIGDLIEAQGHLGSVKEIQLFITTLLTPENKTVIIPNGPLSNGDVVNYTVEGMIRVDMTIGIGYGADIKKAKEVLMKVMTDHPKALNDPAPFVGVSELADSSVNLAVRPFAKPEHYWDVYFDVYEAGKIALDDAGVEIPFPQIDVHMQK